MQACLQLPEAHPACQSPMAELPAHLSALARTAAAVRAVRVCSPAVLSELLLTESDLSAGEELLHSCCSLAPSSEHGMCVARAWTRGDSSSGLDVVFARGSPQCPPRGRLVTDTGVHTWSQVRVE